jgi:ABC-type branched-subunit amino acid transport system substrate-binding protein
MRLIQICLIFGTFLMCAGYGCRSKPEARTPQEFIEMYSKAWRNADPETILELRVPRAATDLDMNSARKKAFEDSCNAADRDAIEQSIKRRDFEYTAWSRTTFEGARDHGDHVHVNVRIDAARSEVVLVRNEGVLRIHPNPSQFQ